MVIMVSPNNNNLTSAYLLLIWVEVCLFIINQPTNKKDFLRTASRLSTTKRSFHTTMDITKSMKGFQAKSYFNFLIEDSLHLYTFL